jgi:hypothetical protein
MFSSNIVSNSSILAYSRGRTLVRSADGTLHAVVLVKENALIWQVYHYKSTDNGNTWDNGENISSASSGQISYDANPAIAMDDNGYLHVVWIQSTLVRYRKYTSSWQTAENLTSANTSTNAVIACFGSIVHVAYATYISSKWNIYYKKYDGSWGSEVTICANSAHQYLGNIAVNKDGYVCIVWDGYITSGYTRTNIRCARYTTSWQTIENITDNGNDYPDHADACVAADSDGYWHVAWRGGTPTYPYTYNIQYSKYTGSWAAATLLTNVAQEQGEPGISVDMNNYVHVLWPYIPPSGEEQVGRRIYTTSWQTMEIITNETYGLAMSWVIPMWQCSPKSCLPCTGDTFIMAVPLSSGYGASCDLRYYETSDYAIMLNILALKIKKTASTVNLALTHLNTGNTTKLRTRKGGVTYGIPLLLTTSAYASTFRVYDGANTKAPAQYS